MAATGIAALREEHQPDTVTRQPPLVFEHLVIGPLRVVLNSGPHGVCVGPGKAIWVTFQTLK